MELRSWPWRPDRTPSQIEQLPSGSQTWPWEIPSKMATKCDHVGKSSIDFPLQFSIIHGHRTFFAPQIIHCP